MSVFVFVSYKWKFLSLLGTISKTNVIIFPELIIDNGIVWTIFYFTESGSVQKQNQLKITNFNLYCSLFGIWKALIFTNFILHRLKTEAILSVLQMSTMNKISSSYSFFLSLHIPVILCWNLGIRNFIWLFQSQYKDNHTKDNSLYMYNSAHDIKLTFRIKVST